MDATQKPTDEPPPTKVPTPLTLDPALLVKLLEHIRVIPIMSYLYICDDTEIDNAGRPWMEGPIHSGDEAELIRAKRILQKLVRGST